jgi:protein-tyrosine-phosphatase
VKPAVDLIGRGSAQHQSSVSGGQSNISGGQIDTARIANIIGHEGEQSGQVYKITIGRDDINLTEMGAKINARMGLNTWAAFFGTDASAEIAGDVAMLQNEITPVLKALRSHGLNVVAIHNHMTDGQPFVYFLHYWGTGPADRLATGFKAALDVLGTRQKGRSASLTRQDSVVFVCEHGAAKSVVAAALFDRIAAERNLPYRALARGVSPDPAIPESIMRGLTLDGLTPTSTRPEAIRDSELTAAARVVTIACELPPGSPQVRRTDWTDIPAFAENYEAGRTALQKRIEALVAELAEHHDY